MSKHAIKRGVQYVSRPGRFDPVIKAASTHSTGGRVTPKFHLVAVQKIKFSTLPRNRRHVFSVSFKAIVPLLRCGTNIHFVST